MATQWTSNALSGGGGGLPPGDELDSKSLVLLLYGKNSFGNKIYSYVKITLGNLKKLKAAIDLGKGFMPSDFGEVLYAGTGEPTDAVRTEMKALYQVMDSQKKAASAEAYPAANTKKKAWDEY
jgi:hypothetical protein